MMRTLGLVVARTTNASCAASTPPRETVAAQAFHRRLGFLTWSDDDDARPPWLARRRFHVEQRLRGSKRNCRELFPCRSVLETVDLISCSRESFPSHSQEGPRVRRCEESSPVTAAECERRPRLGQVGCGGFRGARHHSIGRENAGREPRAALALRVRP